MRVTASVSFPGLCRAGDLHNRINTLRYNLYMPISRNDVEHIARLARLELSEEEIVRFGRQLSDILDYAARLGELDTQHIPPTATVLPLKSVLRPDEPGVTLERSVLMSNAPMAQDEQFRTPPVKEDL